MLMFDKLLLQCKSIYLFMYDEDERVGNVFNIKKKAFFVIRPWTHSFTQNVLCNSATT